MFENLSSCSCSCSCLKLPFFSSIFHQRIAHWLHVLCSIDLSNQLFVYAINLMFVIECNILHQLRWLSVHCIRSRCCIFNSLISSWFDIFISPSTIFLLLFHLQHFNLFLKYILYLLYLNLMHHISVWLNWCFVIKSPGFTQDFWPNFHENLPQDWNY